MKKLVFVLISVFIFSACSHQLLDLTHAKKEVQDYYESGQYDHEMDEIIAGAFEKLENVKFDKNSAAVFDIDETALANYPHIKSLDFGDESKLWDEWVFSAKAKAIPQTKRLYDFLVSKGVKIFFITGRNMKYYEATRKNLIDQGYTKIDSLILRGEKDKGTPAVQYKSRCRAELVKNGANIIANIGDQKSDYEGGYSGIIIKLPNYLYVID